MKEILVVANKYPDLDGCACAYAYAEFLNKSGKQAIAGYQNPHIEAEFVFDKLGIPLPNNGQKLCDEAEQIVLVDTSHNGPDNMANPAKVIEIIDHRKHHEAHLFPNAQITIELVGSASTLIVEKFREFNIKPSTKSALLLYYTAVSHTIRFQSKVTTQRDKDAASGLLDFCDPEDKFIDAMFAAKSKLTKSLEEFMFDEFVFDKGLNTVIVQLEIVDVEEFITKNRSDIATIVSAWQKKYGFDVFLLTCIDVNKLYNKFVVFNDRNALFWRKVLGIDFINRQAKRNGILMRKEIWPKVRKYFVNDNYRHINLFYL